MNQSHLNISYSSHTSTLRVGNLSTSDSRSYVNDVICLQQQQKKKSKNFK